MKFNTSQNFEDFLQLYRNNPARVIFFTGAGLSMPLFPNWQTFLKDLVNYTDAKGKLRFDKTELLEKIDKGLNFLEIADHCAEAIGKNEYREIIEKNFDKEFTYEDIPNAYKILLSLQFKSLITTNYDRIPEIGSQGKYNCYNNRNISEALKAIEKGKKVVLKIHGDILNQDSIVLTAEDFKDIINNNKSVQNALRSIFSTSTICFIGFGLSDPHFNLILEFLNAINNGQNIIHYAFLSGKSAFEIHSLEKKNGIKVIEYIPSSAAHPEVEEFVNLLKGVNIPLSSSASLNTEKDLLLFIQDCLRFTVGITKYYIDYDSTQKRITINYFTRASTNYELQKEVLSIYRIFNFETELLEYVKICTIFPTEPNIEYTEFSPMDLVSLSTYINANKFACKKISESDFWTLLGFNQPSKLGNIHFIDRNVDFPYINY